MNTAVLEPKSTRETAVVVREFTPSDSARWDSFVAEQADATFFHRLGWKTVIEQAFGHQARFLLAERDGELTGILPLFHMRSLLFGHALVSTPFCVYGGVVASDANSAAALCEQAHALAKQIGADYLELRHRKSQCPEWPSKDLYVTFRKTIADSDEENLAAVPRKQRAMIRKGQKAGLDTRIDSDIDSFYEMYSFSVRNLGTPVFSRRFFRLLTEVFADDTEILVVHESGQPVSAVMSFYHRDEVLPYYGGGSTRARAVKANDFMYWEVMRRATARGVKIFDYGRSKQGTGSYRFKKHWGFEPEPLHYEYGLVTSSALPDLSPANPKYRMFIAAWKRLPLPVSQLLGPFISRNLG